MSELIATVTKIKSQDSLNLVDFDFLGRPLRMMSLELASNISVGSQVKLMLKPTAVALGRDVSGILSYSNRLDATVKQINRGKLLCSVLLDCNGSTLESIITKESFLRLQIGQGDVVTAFIKASELSIKEVCHD